MTFELSKRRITHVYHRKRAANPSEHNRFSSAPFESHLTADSIACKTSGFYHSPAMNQNITTGQKFDIEWDPTCLDANAVDIYLYMPNADNSRVHMWQNVNFDAGSYAATIHASWWNSTEAAVKLQLKIVPNGSPPFLSNDLPAAPIFTAIKGEKDNGKVTGGIETVNNFGGQGSSRSKGKIAAGVLIPLLFIIGAAVYAWIRYKRNKGREDRKRWSEAVDKRMSTISTDWKSISAAGASAAIRNSLAVGGSGSRTSSFSFGPIRPATMFSENQAGIGTRAGEDIPQMSQLRPGLRTSAVGVNRVSRVSFAADTRPSGESRRTTRAFHNGHIPPVPPRQDSSDLSPTQTAGPLPLTADDIRDQMSGKARSSMDDYMPALSSKSLLPNVIGLCADRSPSDARRWKQ